jgi:hypothetical protein
LIFEVGVKDLFKGEKPLARSAPTLFGLFYLKKNMASGKKSFVLYCDLMEIVHDLSDEEAGKLIKMIVDYVNDKNPVSEDRIISLAFRPIKNSLKSDLKKWEDIKEKRSEIGRLGGLAKASKSKQVLPIGKQKQANLAVSVNVNDNVNDIFNKDSHNEIFRKLWTSGQWIESLCIKWKCEKTDLLNHLNDFRQECIDKDEFKIDEKDAKTHFINWVKRDNPVKAIKKNKGSLLINNGFE